MPPGLGRAAPTGCPGRGRRAPPAAARLPPAAQRSRTRAPAGARRAHPLEERVGGLEEADARRAVVHRHRPARRQASHDRAAAWAPPIVGPPPTGTNSRSTSPIACRLLGAQRALAEVAEVSRPAGRRARSTKIVFGPRSVPAPLVVLGRDRRHLADRRLQAARGRADQRRIAADRLDAVVVAVLVSDQQQVRLDALDRRVVELRCRGSRQRRHVAERVDDDRRTVVASKTERRLSVPLNLHAAPPLSRSRVLAGAAVAVRCCGADCRRLAALVLAAAHQRRGRRDQARDDREGERLVQPGAERLRDQVREERAAGEHRAAGRRAARAARARRARCSIGL